MISYRLIIPVSLFFIFRYEHVLSEVYTFEPPNLKTVLFRETDLMPRCWSTHEVNLLLNRRVLQDLIPRKIPRDLPLLLKYLKNLEDLVNQIPAGLNQTLVMAAMGDVIGGYLQAIVLPIANEAYYAGNVDYNTVSQLHGMLDRWKWYLSTDGGSWSRECDMRKIPTKVATLDLNLQNSEAACQELYVSPATNETDYIGSETVIAESSRIAIPYFDNNMAPNAIALPFKSRNLYSLMDPKAAYILVKYYTLAMRCLYGNANDVLAFNNFFHIWIVSKVVPHLHDLDRWYPALGAVMRVVETIKQKGLASTNQVFVPPLSEDHQDVLINTNLDGGGEEGLKHTGRLGSYFHIYNNPYAIVILFVIIVAIMLILCCLCACCCWSYQQKKRKRPTIYLDDDTDDSLLKNALISLYCGLKDSLGGSGSKLSNEPPSQNLPVKESIQRSHYPSYEPSHPSYDPPHPSYDPPHPSYDPPRPSYNPPRPSHDAPRPSHDAPRPSHDAPRPSYNQPSVTQPYPHNTPAADTSEVSLSLTSDSDGEYSTTSRDEE